MFDLSYLHLLQLSARDPHLLTQRLNLLTDQLTGRIFTPSDDGGVPSKEHTAVLFHPASGSRRRCLGEVTFLWIPETGSAWRRLWLWIHPAFAAEILSQLTDVLGLAAPDDSGATQSGAVAAGGDISATTPSGAVKAGDGANIERSQGADEKREDSEGPKAKRAKIEKDPDRVHATKLAARNVPSAIKAPRLVATGIELTVLTGTVNRFRLVGPLSAPLLSAVCRPAAVVPEAANNTPDSGCGGGENTAANLHGHQRRWWQRFYADPRARTQLAAQSQCLADLSARSDPAQGVLQGCTVRDPRLLIPVRRPVDVAQQRKAESTTKPASPENGQKAHNVLSDSPFFSTEIRWAFAEVSRELKNKILGSVKLRIMDLDAVRNFYHCAAKNMKVVLEKL
jgi:hypothetical protein